MKNNNDVFCFSFFPLDSDAFSFRIGHTKCHFFSFLAVKLVGVSSTVEQYSSEKSYLIFKNERDKKM